MIERIAFHQGRSDEGPNVALAELLAKKRDASGVAEIAGGIRDANPSIAGDCVKVLYEIGYREPSLLIPHAGLLIACIESRNNRLAWGACIALAQIAEEAADALFANLDAIQRTLEKGSVIAVDNCVSIMALVAKADARYEKRILPLIIEHLAECRPKDVGQHAERAFACVNASNAARFKAVLGARRPALTEPQKKRVDKLVRRIDKEFP